MSVIYMYIALQSNKYPTLLTGALSVIHLGEVNFRKVTKYLLKTVI